MQENCNNIFTYNNEKYTPKNICNFSHDFINKTPHVISTLLKYKTGKSKQMTRKLIYSKWKCYLSIKMRNNKNINSNLNFLKIYIKKRKNILSFIYIDFRLKTSKISSVDFPYFFFVRLLVRFMILKVLKYFCVVKRCVHFV